jgi:trimeric autotransporter adhesin
MAGPIVAQQVTTWDGSAYSAVDCPNGLSFEMLGPVQASAIINNQFVCGGVTTFVYFGCPLAPLGAAWNKMVFNGLHWDSVGTDWTGWINCVASYQGHPLFAGEIGNVNISTTNENSNNITYWNGNNWEVLGSNGNYGLTKPGDFPNVLDAIEFSGELFVSGDFTHAGAMPLTSYNIARWNGSNWLNAGTTFVSAGFFGVYDGELFLGIRGGGTIYKWNGTDWLVFAQTPVVPGNSINDIIEWEGKMAVTGRFASINGIPANNIAVWDGVQWMALDNGINCPVPCLATGISLASLDGSLYVGGLFDIAGNVPLSRLARWGPTAEINEMLIDKIKIQPNPVNQYLQLEGDLSLFEKLTVAGIDGKIIYSGSVQQKSDTSFLDDGIYILQLTTREGLILSKKFVVQN